MIELHEDEYFHSPLEENALRVLLSFVPDLIPRSAYDQLLYRGSKYVRFPIGNPLCDIPKRIQLKRIRSCRVRISQAKKSKKEIKTVYPLASGG